MAIADREGFAAVTMRRVAAEIGASPMSLYHYIRGKDELLALMDDALLAESLLPTGGLPADWRGALTAIARRTRDVFLRHPWALRALQGDAAARGGAISPNAIRHFEQSLAALAGAPLDPRGKVELLTVVDDFVMGHALRAGEERVRAHASAEEIRAATAFAQELVNSGGYTNLKSLAEHAEAASALSDGQAEARFERGLAMLIDGAVRA